MIQAIGSWLAEVYLLSTAVLLAACAAMRCLRQPARRLFVARCATIGLAGLLGLCAWSGLRDATGLAGGRAESVAPSWPDPSGLPIPGSDFRRVGCEMPPTPISMVLRCPDDESSAPPSADGCETDAVDRGTMSPAPAATAVGGQAGSRPVAIAVTAAFLIGSGTTALWLLAGAWMAARLRGATLESPRELSAKLSSIVGAGRRAPALRIGPGVRQPFAIGVLRPTIVLPTRFAGEGEPEGRVGAALRHEWAHIRNGDLALLGLLRAFLPVLYAHPAYWWLRRRVRADQEAVADAQAVHDGDRLGYAEALLAWATSAGAGRPRAGSLALWDRPSELRDRIALLLSPQFPSETRCPLRWRLLVVSIAAAVVVPLAGLSMAGAGAVPPHDCADCAGHSPAPALFAHSQGTDAASG